MTVLTTSNLVNFLNPSAPKGLIHAAQRWVEQAQRRSLQMREPQPEAYCKEVFPSEENIRLLTQPVVNAPYAEYQNVRWTVTEGASLFYLSGARLLGREGVVISPDNRVFAEFTLPPACKWLEHSVFKRRRIPDVTPLKGWYATIAWPESEFYFHWMMESLPRMALLRDYLPMLDGVFVCGKLQRFHIEAMAALGVPRSKLIELNAASHFAPEHLFVPRAFAMYNPPRWLVAWYRSAFRDNVQSQTAGRESARRVYVSRSDAPARKIANEAELIRLLDGHGFVTVKLSELSFAEQASVFENADVIVAGHGAGLSNLVFCRPGAKVIEIMPPRWMAPCFMSLAAVAGCDYRFVVGHTDAGAGVTPQRADVVAPVELLSDVLREFV